jgi:hypothetical protein
MKTLALVIVVSGLMFGNSVPAWAHGDEPHPKCKKGYVLTDDHKCVKKD